MDKNKALFEWLNEKFHDSRDFNKYEAAGCIADAFDDEKYLNEYNASVDYKAVAKKIIDEASRLKHAARDAGLEREATELSNLYFSVKFHLSECAET